MRLHNIAINNLKRRKIKIFFLALGLVIAVSTVVSLIRISNMMSSDLARKIDEFGANIIITPRSDSLLLSYGGMEISGVMYERKEITESDLQKIYTIKNRDNISTVAPKLFGVIKVVKVEKTTGETFENKIVNKDVIIAGVRFNDEIKLKKWWRIIGEKPTKSSDIIVGSEIAKEFNLNIGDRLKLGNNEFTVVEILRETGSQDDAMIFAELDMVQNLMNKPDAISIIEVSALCYDCPIEEIVKQTSEVLPNAKVTAIRQVVESRMHMLDRFNKFSFGISAVMIIIAGLIVFTNITASVNERTREIGIFRAVGFKQTHIMKIILTEVFIISFISGVIGYLVGYLISRLVLPMIIGEIEVVVHHHNNPDIGFMLFSVLLSVAVGTLAGIYPAYKASRLDPVLALRML